MPLSTSQDNTLGEQFPQGEDNNRIAALSTIFKVKGKLFPKEKTNNMLST
jgi:hypothetical protein